MCYQNTYFENQPFYTPWVRGDTLDVFLLTDGSEEDYGYYIDHYEYCSGNIGNCMKCIKDANGSFSGVIGSASIKKSSVY